MSYVLSFSPLVYPVKIKIRLKFSRRFLCLAAISFLAALVGYYIFQVNALTKERYLIRDYEKKVLQFSKTNEILEVNFSKTNSLTNAEKYLSSQIFEKTQNVRYIQLLEDQVVRK